MTSSVKSVTALDFSEQTRTFLQNVSDKTRIVFFVGAGVSVSAGYPLWSKATADALALAQRKGLGTSAASYAREKLDKEQYYEAFGIL
jgi:NAD-dependent SIR2 family protein deacetylase